MSGSFGHGGGDFKPRTNESSRFTTVRITIEGEHYEILVNPDSALAFKQGRNVEPSAVIAVDEVYSDSRKGLRAGSEKLKLHFGTDDHARAALEVLRRGELNLTQEQRKRLTDEKRRAIIAAISKNFVDPIGYVLLADRFVRNSGARDVGNHTHGRVLRDMVPPPVHLLVENFEADVAALVV